MPQSAPDAFSASVFDIVMLNRFPHLSGWGWEREADRTAAHAALDLLGLAAFATRDVLSLSGGKADAAAAERGKPVFAENCVACHGEQAKGNPELGAPNLTDAIWLYGGEPKQIVAQITKPHHGVMPAWQGRLTDAQIKMLAVYVHALGGGQ